LNFELIGAEAARPADHLDALDHILRGRAILLKPSARDNYVQAISLFEGALSLDPRSVGAQSWLGTALADRVHADMTSSAAVDLAHAEGLVGQALAGSPQCLQAHFAQGQILRAQARFEEAIAEYETVIAANRNHAFAIYALGWCRYKTGATEEVIDFVERAIRLSPRDPSIGLWYCLIGRVHLLLSRFDAAIVWFETACNANPKLGIVHACLASAYAHKGETERAAAELAEARRLSGDGRFWSIPRHAYRNVGMPTIRALPEPTYFAGLRKARNAGGVTEPAGRRGCPASTACHGVWVVLYNPARR
jgi:adenylate cyclase